MVLSADLPVCRLLIWKKGTELAFRTSLFTWLLETTTPSKTVSTFVCSFLMLLEVFLTIRYENMILTRLKVWDSLLNQSELNYVRDVENVNYRDDKRVLKTHERMQVKSQYSFLLWPFKNSFWGFLMTWVFLCVFWFICSFLSQKYSR